MWFIFQGHNRIALAIGILFGIGLAIVFFVTEEITRPRPNRPHLTLLLDTYKPRYKATNYYLDWLAKNNFARERLNDDEVSYGNSTQAIVAEDRYLFNKIHVTCVVFATNRKKAEMVKSTYGNEKHCNDIEFFASFDDENVPITVLKSKSTWHHLCQSIRYIWDTRRDTLQWVLFLHDELFAVPENLRYYIAEMGYQYNDTYYLGNPMSFWGQTYNSGKSGYVLSRGSFEAFDAFFNMSGGRTCSTGFNWRNEDFYLGKYLSEIGIRTTDTRDSQGRGRFHGYVLDRLLTVGGISILDSYRKKGVYRVREGFACCSNGTITFLATFPGDLFLFNYLLNHVRVFDHGGHRGNQKHPVSQEAVWLGFMKGLNLENVSLTADEFQNLWDGHPNE